MGAAGVKRRKKKGSWPLEANCQEYVIQIMGQIRRD